MVINRTDNIPSKKIKIRFNERENYLEVVLNGKNTLPGYFAAFDKTFEESQKIGHTRILLDVTDLKGDYTDPERFQLGERISELFRPPYKVVTIEKKEKINKFTENTAVNRGAIFLVTHDRNSGLDWLLKDK